MIYREVSWTSQIGLPTYWQKWHRFCTWSARKVKARTSRSPLKRKGNSSRTLCRQCIMQSGVGSIGNDANQELFAAVYRTGRKHDVPTRTFEKDRTSWGTRGYFLVLVFTEKQNLALGYHSMEKRIVTHQLLLRALNKKLAEVPKSPTLHWSKKPVSHFIITKPERAFLFYLSGDASEHTQNAISRLFWLCGFDLLSILFNNHSLIFIWFPNSSFEDLFLFSNRCRNKKQKSRLRVVSSFWWRNET